MKYSQEYVDTVQLFHDTIAFKPTKRVPHLSNFFTWKIHDSQYTFKEALYDFKIMEKIVCDFHERYNFDAYADLGTRNPMKLYESMGGGSFYIFDEKMDSIQVVDRPIMEGDEYLKFAADPEAFNKELFQRKFPQATAAEMYKGISELISFGQFAGKMNTEFIKKYSRPALFAMNAAILMPAEFFSSTARGIKNYSVDMRRHSDEILEAENAYFETYTRPAYTAAVNSDTSIYAIDCYTALLAYSMMSVKQFEKLYWPHLRSYIDYTVDADKMFYAFCESTMMRFKDFFAELPKGHVVLHPEEDTVYELREALPNVCVAGGMPAYSLGYGTPRECVDIAKELIDTLGEGFIFSQTKMMSFKNDCTRENLAAVCNFVRNYSL